MGANAAFLLSCAITLAVLCRCGAEGKQTGPLNDHPFQGDAAVVRLDGQWGLRSGDGAHQLNATVGRGSRG